MISPAAPSEHRRSALCGALPTLLQPSADESPVVPGLARLLRRIDRCVDDAQHHQYQGKGLHRFALLVASRVRARPDNRIGAELRAEEP
jgi:hypothetical protein